MITSVAAIVFTVVTSVVAGFQLRRALGAPWGAYAMSGRFPGAFPALMRVAAIMQTVLLALWSSLCYHELGSCSFNGRVCQHGPCGWLSPSAPSWT